MVMAKDVGEGWGRVGALKRAVCGIYDADHELPSVNPNRLKI